MTNPTVSAVGKIVDATVSVKSGKMRVTIETDRPIDGEVLNCLSAVSNLKIDIKEYRPKRTLDANAYMWVLLDKLSAVLRVPKTDIYRSLIRDIGGNSEIVCVRESAVDKLCEAWERNGIGWQTERFPSKLRNCTNVVLYYGSSTYTSEQMALLLDRVIEECRWQNIETATPDEIANMKSLWATER